MTRSSILGLALVGLLVSVPGHGAGLGRFFTDPETRHALNEAQRSGKALSQDELEKKKQEKQLENRYITYNGVVKRSGGPATVWVNGVSSVQGGEVFSGVTLSDGLNNTEAHYTLPSGMGQKPLQPGQTLATGRGEVKERYEMREPPPVVASPKEDKAPDSGNKVEEGAPSKPQKLESEGKPGKRKSQRERPKSKEMQEAEKLERMLEDANKLKDVSDHYTKQLEGMTR